MLPDTEDLNWQGYYNIAYKTTIDYKTKHFQYRFLNDPLFITVCLKKGTSKRKTSVIFVMGNQRQWQMSSGAVKQ